MMDVPDLRRVLPVSHRRGWWQQLTHTNGMEDHRLDELIIFLLQMGSQDIW